MTFQDRTQPDPSQPLTLDRPQTDPSLPPPYPRPQYGRAQMPPSVFMSNTTQPRREPNDWGGDHWPITATANNPGMPGDQNMPSGFEAYPTLAKSGGYLAQNGSDNINQNAQRVSSLAMGFSPLLDMLSSGAFSRGFNESSLNHIKIKQAQLAYEGEQLQFRHAQELADYGEIFAKADAITKDPKATQAQKIQAIEDAREELRFLAETKYGHHRLTALLDTHGGLDVAKQFLSDEDAYFKDAWAGTTSLKKTIGADRDADTAKEFGISPQAGIGHGGGIFGHPLDVAEEESQADAQAPKPAGSDYDRDIMKKTGTSPEELAMARQVAMGQTPESYTRRAKLPASQRTPTENKALSDVDRLTNQMSRDTEDAANKQDFDRLRQINPALATDIGQLGTYAVDPVKEDRLGDRRYVNSLVGRFFPGWDPSLYQVKKNIEDDTKPEGRSIKAAGASLQPMMILLDAINKLPQHDSFPTAVIKEAIDNKVLNTGPYREVSNATQLLAVQLSAITTGSNIARVTIFKQRMDNMGAAISPEVLRDIVKQEAADIWEYGLAMHQSTWENKFHRKDLVPGLTPDMGKDFSAIMRMDRSGRMPKDASSTIMSIGRSTKEGNEPLTASQAREVDKRFTGIINNPDLHNPSSPNYKELQYYFNLYKSLMPPVRLPPWTKPEFD